MDNLMSNLMKPLIALFMVFLLAGCVGPQPASNEQINPELSSAPWDNARQRGVDFRAIGQEPGWHLEIRKDHQILFVYDYGAHRLEFPAVTPTRSEKGDLTYHTRAGSKNLMVTVTPEPCADIMSGEQFDHAVSVSLNDKVYRGCGRRL